MNRETLAIGDTLTILSSRAFAVAFVAGRLSFACSAACVQVAARLIAGALFCRFEDVEWGEG